MPSRRPAPSAVPPGAGLGAARRPLAGITLHRGRWAAAGVALALLGAVALLRWDIAQRREAFAADARVAHRLLSQHAAQLDAVLATLVLLAPAPTGAEQRLPALLPAVLAVLRRDAGQAWPDPALAAAEARSRALPPAQRHAVLGTVDVQQRQYTLVLAGEPTSYALRVDARRLVPDTGWPLADDGPVRAVLTLDPEPRMSDAARQPPLRWQETSPLASQADPPLVLHTGAPQALHPAGLTPGFTFNKLLATRSQPFALQLQRATGPAQWPWGWMLAWAVACATVTATVLSLLRARQAQRRSAELMRLAQAARLGSLGELAAGMAHELNQPLAAVLASTQAAQRLLQDADPPTGEGPDLASARQALDLAARQARRASDVVARLRRLVQDPTRSMALQSVDLNTLAAQMLQLLTPELQRRGIAARLQGTVPPVWADPVALEQIVHNLVSNAMQALESAATPAPMITLLLQAAGDGQAPLPGADGSRATLRVRDNGPGIAPEHLGRVFEPFFTTHAGGLGLGLPLCESLAQAMGGELVVMAAHGERDTDGDSKRQSEADTDAGTGTGTGTGTGPGAEFQLSLPLARTAAAAR